MTKKDNVLSVRGMLKVEGTAITMTQKGMMHKKKERPHTQLPMGHSFKKEDNNDCDARMGRKKHTHIQRKKNYVSAIVTLGAITMGLHVAIYLLTQGAYGMVIENPETLNPKASDGAVILGMMLEIQLNGFFLCYALKKIYELIVLFRPKRGWVHYVRFCVRNILLQGSLFGRLLSPSLEIELLALLCVYLTVP